MVGFTIFGVAAVLMFIGAKSTYYIWKVLGGLAWWGLGVWWVYSPFTTAGTPPHEIMLAVVFVAGVAAFFWAFWSERTKNGQPTGNGRFRMPFMPTDEDEEASKGSSIPNLRQRNAAYQERLDAASRGERRR